MTITETTEIRAGHQLDAARLEKYLSATIPGFRGPMTLRQFAGGQSNPTYLIETPARSYVLRKKPSGDLLVGAHAIEREYKVMEALAGSGVPVPRVAHLCTDPEIIGTPFFVMEHVQGRIARRASLPDSTPAERTTIYAAMAAIAAALHNADWRAAGLSDFGKHSDYIARQIRLWTRQYEAEKTHDILAMDRLIAWLPEHMPAEGRIAIAHGDFRLENLIFHPQENRVLAIIDWELATLGDPLADIAYNCMVYHVPPEMPGVRGIGGLDLAALGIPSEAEYLQDYCALTGRDGIADWDFYLTLAMFRSASILQGIYARALRNNAANPDALVVGKVAQPLAEIAWGLATRRG